MSSSVIYIAMYLLIHKRAKVKVLRVQRTKYKNKETGILLSQNSHWFTVFGASIEVQTIASYVLEKCLY